MQSTPDAYDPAAIEQATRQFWRSRGLPPADGSVGPATGARIHQIIGTIASDQNPVALVQGGVLADVDARYFALTGRRTIGRLLVRPTREDAPDPRAPALLEAAGAWAGGTGTAPRDAGHDADRVQHMVERLAESGILVRRESPLRSCPRCRVPRTLAGILYHEEEGPAYLVRFPLSGATPPVSLVVWTDAAWKLLGAPAVLAQADAPYVIMRYRRRGSEERVLIAKSSVPRLQAWLPGGEWEVVEEMPGASLDGRAYDHPLGTESPMLGRPPAPSGQVHLSSEVTDSGTGFVALVPAHGAADAAASRTLDLPGWPVLDHDLALTSSFRHKYQGLPVESGEAFVIRDLREGGYLFAELTVRRGVPRCAVCHTALIWETGSAWCLVPAALPAARLDLFARLIPGERAPPSTEVVPWPVSGRELVDDPLVPELRECEACHRLSARASGPKCDCGGTTQAHRRRLLPVFREALLAWADESPFPSGEAARLYLPASRRVPTLIHHLVAMEAADAHPGELRVHPLTTLPQEQSLDDWLASSPRDAARAALVSLTETPRGGAAALVERRAQHAYRLRRFWALAQTVATAARADRTLGGMPPIASRYGELLEEDRALLSRFERTRRDVLAAYEAGDPAAASRLLEQFFDGPLRSIYLPAASRRLAGPPAGRGPVIALLAHLLVTWSELYGPVAPFTAEAVSQLFVADGRSLFERPVTPILDSALDPALEERSASWWAIVDATRRARRHLAVPESVAIPQIVLGARDEAQAGELRASSAVIGRLINADRVEVASPQLPWSGRTLQVTPVLPALQKVFGSGAPRVARILQGLAPLRVRDGIRSKTLEIAVEGRPLPIGPAMVEIAEHLPDGFLTFPWAGGELIVRAPTSAPAGTPDPSRVLSSDAYRVVRRVRQRIRWANRPEGVRVVVVCATGALSEELVRLAPSLATSLGVPLFRVVASTEGFPLSETTTGRTGRGLRWAVWVPGSRRPEARGKDRAARARQERIRRAIRWDPTPELTAEIQSEPSVRRDAEIDRWVVQLDELVGRPLVGPAKLRAAWDAGLQQYDDLIHAPYERLAAIAGFGPVVAAELVTRAGGTVPARPRPVLVAPAAPRDRRRPTVAPDVEVTPPTEAASRTGLASQSGDPAGGASGGARAEGSLSPGEVPAPTTPAASLVGSIGLAPDARADPPLSPPSAPPPVLPPPPEPVPEARPETMVPETPTSRPPSPVEPVGPTNRPEVPPDAGQPGPSPPPTGPEVESPSAATPTGLPVTDDTGSPAGVEPTPPEPLPSERVEARLDAGDAEDPRGTVVRVGIGVPEVSGIQAEPPSAARAVSPDSDGISEDGVVPALVPSADASPAEEAARGGAPSAETSGTTLQSVALDAPLPAEATSPDERPAATRDDEPSPADERRLVDPSGVGPSDPTDVAADDPGELRDVPADELTVQPGESPSTKMATEEAAVQPASAESSIAPEAAEPEAAAPPREVPDLSSADPSMAPTAPLVEGSAEPASAGSAEGVASVDAAPQPAFPPEPVNPDTATPSALPSAPDLVAVPESGVEATVPVRDSLPPSEAPSPPEPPVSELPPVEQSAQASTSEPAPPALIGPALPPEAPVPTPLETELPVVLPLPGTPAPPPVSVEAGANVAFVPLSPPEPALAPPPIPAPPPPPASGLAVSSAALGNDAWPLFLDATGAGHRGLCVSREFPDRMRALLGPRDVTIIWLSNSTRPGSLRPTDLEGLAQAVEKAVATEHVRAIYLDHVEYLTRVNTAAAVRTLLERVDASARAHEARAWVALNPSLLAVEAAEVLTNGFPSAH